MDDYFEEENIDYFKVTERAGENSLGDEDFHVFKCPLCKTVYLMDFEMYSIFVDPNDLSRQVSDEKFICVSCGYQIPDNDVLIGPEAKDRYRPTITDVRSSGWSWIQKDKGAQVKPFV